MAREFASVLINPKCEKRIQLSLFKNPGVPVSSVAAHQVIYPTPSDCSPSTLTPQRMGPNVLTTPEPLRLSHGSVVLNTSHNTHL